MRREIRGDVGVGSWIERRARLVPERAALVSGSRVLSYEELAARVRRLANGLRGLGVAPGDRVAWLGQNDPAFLECFFAAGLLGAVIAPVNHRLPADERAFVVADSDPVVVVEHHAAPQTAMPAGVRARLSVGGERHDALDYEALIGSSPDEPVEVPVALDDLLYMPHTSGTTGRPKGVMLSHGNVTWNVVDLLSCADFRGDDVTLAIAPFFRVGGTGVNVLPVLFLGGTVVVPEVVEADHILDLVERHRVTVGFGNPDLLEALARAKRWATADLSSIRFILTGGAPVPERLLRTYQERGLTILQGYGLSEAAPLVLLLDPAHALQRVGSAGRPPLLVEVRIVDPEDRDVAPGQTGELLARGPNVMSGYWRRPEATAEVLLPGGWLRTGDAARMDRDGFVWIVDRATARYTTVGGAVFPGDVERVLLAHPAVDEAGVVGIPGPDGHVVGAAFVVVATGASVTDEELLAFAAARLPQHAVPATIRRLPELPRNSVGKLRRQDLAALVSGEA